MARMILNPYMVSTPSVPSGSSGRYETAVAAALSTSSGSITGLEALGSGTALGTDPGKPQPLYDAGVGWMKFTGTQSLRATGGSGGIVSPTWSVAWIFRTSSAGPMVMAHKGDGWYFGTNGDNYAVFSATDGAVTMKIDSGAWEVHDGDARLVLVTYDGGDMRMYVNGNEVAGSPFSDALEGLLDQGTSDLVVGRDSSSLEPYDGALACLWVWDDKVLDSTEQAQLNDYARRIYGVVI